MYVSVVSIFVEDQDRAIDFYTKALGWDKTMDEPMGPDYRWVTVGPKGGQAMLHLSKTSEFMPNRKPGELSGVILECDDVFRAHEELTKTGVTFTEPPRNEPWGGWAMFKDSEGNVHGLHSPERSGAT